MPRLGQETLADLDDVEYRDYKRELLRKNRSSMEMKKASQLPSFFVCGLLFFAAAMVLLHHYGYLDAVIIR